jgi:hypothetical protein
LPLRGFPEGVAALGPEGRAVVCPLIRQNLAFA